MYRRRLPWWQRFWRGLTPDQRARWLGFYCSLGSNVSLLLLAALCYIAMPTGPVPLSLTLSPAMDLGDMDETTPFELAEISQPDEPIAEPNLQPDPLPPEPSELFDTPLKLDDPAPPMEPTATGTLQAGSPASLSALSSDSQRIAEATRRVTAAGGSTTAPIRCSLLFSGDDDLDISVLFRGTHSQPEYTGRADGHVWYKFPHNRWGRQDIDCNRDASDIAAYPCENIIFEFPPHQAKYTVKATLFRRRGPPEPVPFVVVVAVNGRPDEIYQGTLTDEKEEQTICSFSYQHSNRYHPQYGSGPSRIPVHK